MSWEIRPQLDQLRAEGLWRELRVMDSPQGPLLEHEGKSFVNFSSNDYLGLASCDVLKAALQDGAARYGAGSGASRLVCGSLRPHAELEAALADFKGTEGALTFSSGFAVPMGTLPALLGPGDTVLLDKLSHACLVDAARLSGATLRVFPHNHLEKLERLLQTAKGRVLIVTESIFSMDGDAAPLREMVALKERYGAWLLLDEAHAVGVLGPQGRGLAAELGLEGRIELQMGTLSKALGLSGGYLAASHAVVDLLINRARSFIYTTAPPPAVAHAALTALEMVRGEEGERRRKLLRAHVENVQTKVGLGNTGFQSAILPLILGDENAAMAASAALRSAGLMVPAIRYPTVARGRARLRLTFSAAHLPEQVERLMEALKVLNLLHPAEAACH
ncbi:8-amino-7-oxononanoate synthase [Prosthecobacter sp. SYSU 5D2]|uniref:8-amino-7-oxononanoate synthase n=1 Tax=Prosthecobacter sp. SYSU 5D2 TaxID=3134134 RepID=UPI0031FF0044